jgi:NAD(P)H-hydrate repair Nnr-like enzyme with NAD(P)H-hydrate dehydratase domain
LENVLQENNINYERGRLNNITRTMDFIIPDKERPKIIIESYYAVTTSSTMGDKAKAEIGVKRQIDRYYDYAVFIGFVDGIAWFTRQGDLKQLVSAFDNVFTFHPLEIERFLTFATDILGK